MEDKRPVELIVCESYGGDSGHWFTVIVDVPVDTPDGDISQIAMDKLSREYPSDLVLYVGVFNIPSPDELDDWYCEEE